MSRSLWAIIVGKPNIQLTDWLHAQDIAFDVRSHAYEPAIARNIAIQEFLASDHRALLVIDGDQNPTSDTRILEADQKPLVYCGSPSRNIPLKGHFGVDDFSAGCFRVNREVLQAVRGKLDDLNSQLSCIDFPFAQPMELGWFGRALKDYGTNEYHCSCEWFNGLARSVGCEAEMVGTLGHAGLFLTREHTSFATGERFAG